jgi:hypothetical protein
MKIYTTDEMTAATLTPSTENTQFPAVNVQNFQPTNRWYTLGTQAAETLVIDLSTATLVDTLIVAGHNFDGTETTVKIQGNATDSWGGPTVDETMTVIVGQPFKKKFTGQSLRFWRFIFTKAAAGDIKQVGRLWLGNQIDTGTDGDPNYTGAAVTTIDRSVVVKSIGGQSYIEIKQQFESFKLDLSIVPETAMLQYVTEFRLMGTHTPYFIVISSQDPLDRIWYVRNTNNLGRKVKAFNSSFLWNTGLDLEEII